MWTHSKFKAQNCSPFSALVVVFLAFVLYSWLNAVMNFSNFVNIIYECMMCFNLASVITKKAAKGFFMSKVQVQRWKFTTKTFRVRGQHTAYMLIVNLSNRLGHQSHLLKSPNTEQVFIVRSVISLGHQHWKVWKWISTKIPMLSAS